MKRPGASKLAALTLAVLAATTLAVAQDTDSAGKVKVSVTVTKPDGSGKQVATVSMKIDKTWHIYANPVGLEDLSSVQTVVSVSSTNKPEDVKIEYPEGKVVKDKVLGDYRKYEDKVTIKATVRRAKGDTEPLNLSVKFQACSDKACLLPATVKLNVP